jgi:hypothetical protein
MENLWRIVGGAPWWVYVLFLYLVNVGVQSMKPRTVSIKRITLLPVFFLIWSCYGLYQKFLLGLFSLILLWVLFLAIGTYFGVKEARSWQISKNYLQGEITIPGNYSTLLLILLVFILKFFWGYFYATRTEISYWIYFTDILTSALGTGFFMGRMGFLFKSYHNK